MEDRLCLSGLREACWEGGRTASSYPHTLRAHYFGKLPENLGLPLPELKCLVR